jgi:hypothetical protein
MSKTTSVVHRYFEQKLSIELTKSEIEEIVQALYYFNRARIRFALLSKRKEGKV